ncbi:uncharacterized protein BDZ99DRAFT_527310 [Mytilinidion resinicola]|uniref:Uncharacterized protein n=1 Tax=Mytilinidion resinicola TaxID=574789 RepID=A0A6A6Y1D1_9PEZI|nr:uncharacterized protein BDZ99DRAFT_527310 [Mytilinidion resinicola]KAF2802582.1 hypothetical protein BDZ99DRAFT_527310 [Mytilinidion resinicola]
MSGFTPKPRFAPETPPSEPNETMDLNDVKVTGTPHAGQIGDSPLSVALTASEKQMLDNTKVKTAIVDVDSEAWKEKMDLETKATMLEQEKRAHSNKMKLEAQAKKKIASDKKAMEKLLRDKQVVEVRPHPAPTGSMEVDATSETPSESHVLPETLLALFVPKELDELELRPDELQETWPELADDMYAFRLDGVRKLATTYDKYNKRYLRNKEPIISEDELVAFSRAREAEFFKFFLRQGMQFKPVSLDWYTKQIAKEDSADKNESSKWTKRVETFKEYWQSVKLLETRLQPRVFVDAATRAALQQQPIVRQQFKLEKDFKPLRQKSLVKMYEQHGPSHLWIFYDLPYTSQSEQAAIADNCVEMEAEVFWRLLQQQKQSQTEKAYLEGVSGQIAKIRAMRKEAEARPKKINGAAEVLGKAVEGSKMEVDTRAPAVVMEAQAPGLKNTPTEH